MIHERRGATASAGYVEVWRDECPSVLILTAAAFDELGEVRTENSRWRLLKAAAIAKRQKRQEDQ